MFFLCLFLLFNVVIMSQAKQLTLEEFSILLDEKLKPINHKMDDLVENISFMNERFESLVQRIDDVENKYSELVKENKCLKDEVLRLSKIAEHHKDEINDLQQYTRRDCVEIYGLPQQMNEDTNQLVIKVGSLMGLDIKMTDISISHRLPQNTNSYSSRLRSRDGNRSSAVSKFPKLIVKFTRRETKELFYQSRKKLIDKTTKHISSSLGRVSDNRIFIGESLSQRNRELFTASLKLKKEKNFKFIWTQSGRIYLRKADDSPAHLIRNKDDLNSLR